MSENPEWLSAITDPDVDKRTSAVRTLAASSQAKHIAGQLAQVLYSAGHLVRVLSEVDSAKSEETATRFVSYCQDVAKYLPLEEIWTSSSMDWGDEHYPEGGFHLWGGNLRGLNEKGEAMWLLKSGQLLAIRISDSTSRYTSTTQCTVEPLILAPKSQQAIRVVRITASGVYDTYRQLVRKNDPQRKEIASLLFDSTKARDSSMRSKSSSERAVSKAQRREQSLIMRLRRRDEIELYRQQAAEADRKRESEREAQKERLRREREPIGLCIVCGKKLSVVDKAFGVPQHKRCL